ncbi:uncharacterized protein LOC106012102 [Aplysia californica]|uniref:Uncharacterized protein LOC106012102 n=1 Tax=Aplysia californica TaxID=6500 RepID=A0ABM1A279_APLCA|nr:uncharacterized protein LOC106012102 [Aplysia californica]
MTSDLCLAFLTTWLVAVSAAPGPSNLQTRSTNGACNVNGVVYQDGQRFKLSQQSCITYLCKAGGYSIVEQGCLSGGACHDVGTNFTDDCHLYTCQSILSGGYVTLKKSLVQARCKDANNMCHDPGDLFPFDYNGQIHQGCTCTATGNQVAYSCDTGSSSSSSSSNNSSKDCQVDGFKFSNGQRVSIPGKSKCVKYLCTDGHASIVQKGCEVDNFCHSVGSSIQDKCDVYKCVEEQVGNAISLHTNLIFRGCIDANTRCRAPGEKFPYVINGVLEQDCTCSDVGGQIRYSCTSVVASHNCTVNGHEFADGQEFVYPGQSKCVKYKCDKGSYKPVQEGCEANGACHAIGSVFETNCVLKACKKITYPDRSVLSSEVLMRRCRDSNGQCQDPGNSFSYEINSQVRNDCTCSVNGTQTSYRCGLGAGSGGASGSGQSGTQTTAVAGKNCSVGENTYTDGQVFAMPGMTKCVKYMCSNGGYRVIEEGCELNGVCHDVGSIFSQGCHFYTCNKVQSGVSYTYKTAAQTLRCKDADNICQDPGSTFPLVIGGHRYEQCTCNLDNGSLRYSCSG